MLGDLHGFGEGGVFGDVVGGDADGAGLLGDFFAVHGEDGDADAGWAGVAFAGAVCVGFGDADFAAHGFVDEGVEVVVGVCGGLWWGGWGVGACGWVWGVGGFAGLFPGGGEAGFVFYGAEELGAVVEGAAEVGVGDVFVLLCDACDVAGGGGEDVDGAVEGDLGVFYGEGLAGELFDFGCYCHGLARWGWGWGEINWKLRWGGGMVGNFWSCIS